MEAGMKRERVRRASLAVLAASAPLPVAGIVLSGTGLPWAVLPAAAGVVTIATARAKRTPAPIPAPAQYPARLHVVAQVVPAPAGKAGAGPDAVHELASADAVTGCEVI
ncbi:MAG: hypothetical protein ACJ786_29330 [Catenulispora sp.]